MERHVEAVPEEVVRLRVNDRPVLTWTCTPAALEALAAGRLLALGFIGTAADLLDLRVTGPGVDAPDGSTLHARVPRGRFDAAMEERRHRGEHGCGLRFLVTCRRDLLPDRRAPVPLPPPDRLPALFRSLFDGSASRRTTGGHHSAALCDGDTLHHLHEEVGRHNAADKAIGAALLDGAPLEALGIVTTARISGEIAEKAARAGLGWIASRSVPTTLAVDIAVAAGVPILARAAGPDARVIDGVPGRDA